MGSGVVVEGGSDVFWGEMYIYWCVSMTNNNHPPRIGCLLVEKRVVALEMSIGGGGGEHACTKNAMKPTIYREYWYRRLGSDGGAEAAEATKKYATMILREVGTVLVAKMINNLCWNWLTVLLPCHVSSGRYEIITQRFWGYERVEHQATIKGTKWYVYGGFMAILPVERS
jgi:hypothetical protein